MINSANSSESPARRTPLEEEQRLCNEALRSGAFDVISDKEWIALCESAANKGRVAAEADQPAVGPDDTSHE